VTSVPTDGGAGHQVASIELDGKRLRLTNLAKVLYPDAEFTKSQVIDHYARVAPVLLPLLADRPVSRFRWPNGTSSASFVEKESPRGTPSWVRTVTLDAPGSGKDRGQIRYPLADDVPTLVWLANLAALELHVPQWRVGPRGGVRDPDRLVLDLDPGSPAGLAECAVVALLLRERLAADGLDAVPVTSGSKGLQLYAPISGEQSSDAVSGYAKRLAEDLARDHRDLVVSSMTRSVRGGKVLLDWSQNHHAKTTISPYSLRGRARPTVAAPRTWAEIEDDDSLRHLTSSQVLARLEPGGVDADGALVALLAEPGPRVPSD
jgi:bifunctional non-homologous end joining protein LigD